MPEQASVMTGAPLAARSFVARAADMKVVAALMNDPNPIHWDVAAVRAAGMGERVVNQGPITISFLMNLAMEVAGASGAIRRFDGRFLSNVFDGDEVLCQAWRDASTGGRDVTGLALLATVNGQPVASATCEICEMRAGAAAVGSRS